ncbi:hypothetical protein M5K25_013890 [Dendrobium thyrsiflorum]|uniref:Uncharacterized protein n=1 Tax=Dendrobium thyrsiflorum TaxID=117978 RepID=A0ABD0UU09_DENTH
MNTIQCIFGLATTQRGTFLWTVRPHASPMSISSGFIPSGFRMASCSSCCNLVITIGFFISSVIVHIIVAEDVSVPAKNKSTRNELYYEDGIENNKKMPTLPTRRVARAHRRTLSPRGSRLGLARPLPSLPSRPHTPAQPVRRLATQALPQADAQAQPVSRSGAQYQNFSRRQTFSNPVSCWVKSTRKPDGWVQVEISDPSAKMGQGSLGCFLIINLCSQTFVDPIRAEVDLAHVKTIQLKEVVRWKSNISRWFGESPASGGGPAEVRHQAVAKVRYQEEVRYQAVVLQKSGVSRWSDGSMVVRWKSAINRWSAGSTVSGGGPTELRRQEVVWRYSGQWSRRSEEARAISDLSLTSLPLAWGSLFMRKGGSIYRFSRVPWILLRKLKTLKTKKRCECENHKDDEEVRREKNRDVTSHDPLDVILSAKKTTIRRFFLQPKQNIHQVLFIESIIGLRLLPTLEMLLDHPLIKPIQLPKVLLQLVPLANYPINPIPAWKEIRSTESSHQILRLRHGSMKPTPPSLVHSGASSKLISEHHSAQDVLDDAELASLPPVLAVLGEGDVGVVKGELGSYFETRPAGEDDVVGFKDGFEGFTGGDD